MRSCFKGALQLRYFTLKNSAWLMSIWPIHVAQRGYFLIWMLSVIKILKSWHRIYKIHIYVNCGWGCESGFLRSLTCMYFPVEQEKKKRSIRHYLQQLLSHSLHYTRAVSLRGKNKRVIQSACYSFVSFCFVLEEISGARTSGWR